MTDTPRTEAELLAIFADNNSGAIEPQDMRDFVVSLMDITGVTFVASRRKPGGIVDGMYDTYDKSAVTDLPAGNDRVIDWRGTVSDTAKTLYDPAGWLNASPIADTGYWGTGSFPTGTVLILPAGVYGWQSTMQVASALTSGSFYVYMDRATDPAASSSDLMKATPTFGNGSGEEENITSLLSFRTGFYVCDEQTIVIPDLFGTLTMNTAKPVQLAQLSVTKVR